MPPLTWNASNLPLLDNFYMARVRGVGVQQAGTLSGSPGAGQPGVLIRNVMVEDVVFDAAATWACVNVTGSSSNVTPPVTQGPGGGCPQLLG